MANNDYVNKVQYENDILIDLTNDTAGPNQVMEGYTFHSASGEPSTGALITHAVYDGLDSSSTDMALSAKQGKILAERTSMYAETLNDLKALVTNVHTPYIVHCGNDCTYAITNQYYGGNMVILAYLTENGYITYIGQCGSGKIVNGWINVSTDVAESSAVPTIHQKHVRFNGITVTSNPGYVKLCTYSQLGISSQNYIISIRQHSGTCNCAVSFECYNDGIYMYSSKEISNKYIILDIIYNPWAAPVYDSDMTITVSS